VCENSTKVLNRCLLETELLQKGMEQYQNMVQLLLKLQNMTVKSTWYNHHHTKNKKSAFIVPVSQPVFY
jgi:hypothetical protein